MPVYQTSAPATDCRESNINNEIQLRETVPIITCAPLLIQEAASIKSPAVIFICCHESQRGKNAAPEFRLHLLLTFNQSVTFKHIKLRRIYKLVHFSSPECRPRFGLTRFRATCQIFAVFCSLEYRTMHSAQSLFSISLTDPSEWTDGLAFLKFQSTDSSQILTTPVAFTHSHSGTTAHREQFGVRHQQPPDYRVTPALPPRATVALQLPPLPW